MTDALRAARDRMRTEWTATSKTFTPVGSPNFDWLRDLAIIVDADLAEHSADDDEQVTKERLASIGWMTYIHWPSIATPAGQLLEWRGAGMWIGETPICRVRTMGDVRRLLVALGIEVPK